MIGKSQKEGCMYMSGRDLGGLKHFGSLQKSVIFRVYYSMPPFALNNRRINNILSIFFEGNILIQSENTNWIWTFMLTKDWDTEIQDMVSKNKLKRNRIPSCVNDQTVHDFVCRMAKFFRMRTAHWPQKLGRKPNRVGRKAAQCVDQKQWLKGVVMGSTWSLVQVVEMDQWRGGFRVPSLDRFRNKVVGRRMGV